MKPNPHFHPVILAGGRGTRFWPLSRKRSAKQLLALDGKKTMIQQTASRLESLSPMRNFWVITNDYSRPAILRQLRKVPSPQVVAEPVGRNSAPAIGLAAFLLLRRDPEAVVGMFPSDHVIADMEGFRATLRKGIEMAAASESIIALGVQPTRAETGYGYIEAGAAAGDGSLRVRRFTEKPDLDLARQFFEAGNYFWNSGMFIWRADTLV
ncbi:MAG: mannose-1-phosphate guanylyltransferase, partial [Terriglobales bacterium]